MCDVSTSLPMSYDIHVKPGPITATTIHGLTQEIAPVTTLHPEVHPFLWDIPVPALLFLKLE